MWKCESESKVTHFFPKHNGISHIYIYSLLFDVVLYYLHILCQLHHVYREMYKFI